MLSLQTPKVLKSSLLATLKANNCSIGNLNHLLIMQLHILKLQLHSLPHNSWLHSLNIPHNSWLHSLSLPDNSWLHNLNHLLKLQLNSPILLCKSWLHNFKLPLKSKHHSSKLLLKLRINKLL